MHQLVQQDLQKKLREMEVICSAIIPADEDDEIYVEMWQNKYAEENLAYETWCSTKNLLPYRFQEQNSPSGSGKKRKSTMVFESSLINSHISDG